MENNIDLTQKTKVRVRKSYVGQKFNMLTVIEELGKNKVLCKCDCGNEKILAKSTVINEGTKSCGCLRRNKILSSRESAKKKMIVSYVGKKFNNLTIIKEIGNGRVIAKCDCGNIIDIVKGNVINGHTKSCGCLRKSKNVRNNIVGKKFGKLTVLKELGGSRVYCQCDCGNGKIVFKPTLLKGEVKSCGCLRKKL